METSTQQELDTGDRKLTLEEVVQLKVEEVVKQRGPEYAEIAEELRTTEAVIKEKLGNEVKRIVNNSGLFIAVTAENLLKIIESGRLKSQFETHTSPAALANLEMRAEAEHIYFGYDKSTPPELRPIYGYISSGAHGEVQLDPIYGRRNWNTAAYGPIVIELNEDIKDRTTIVFDDSLGLEDRVAASKYSEPSIASIKPGTDTIRSILSGKVRSSLVSGYDGKYIEAQFHGGLELKDIKAIHVSTQNGMSYEDIARINGDERITKLLSVVEY